MLDRLTPSSSPSPTCRDALSANAHPQDCSLRTSPNTVPRPAITSSQWTLRTTPLAVMRCRVGSADTAIWCSSPTSPPCDWSPGWKQPPWSPPTCAGQTPPRSTHHPGASCSANWRAWPNVTSPRLSAPNWSFLSLTTPTARRGARATVTSPRPATTTSTTLCSRRRGWSRCCAISATRWMPPACTAKESRGSVTSANRKSHSATPRHSPPATITRCTKMVRKRCNIDISLRGTDGSAVFADRDAPHGMSPLFRQFLAGQLALMREFTLFQAPNINSYKRYVPGSFAPTALAWGLDNRTCAYRVVGHGHGMRVENRVPGGDVNQYLAVAAMIAAGLYGIDHKPELEDAFAGNAYESGVSRVPASLAEDAHLFQQSVDAREAFGDEVVDYYLNYARLELAAFGATITDWERVRGFERLSSG